MTSSPLDLLHLRYDGPIPAGALAAAEAAMATWSPTPPAPALVVVPIARDTAEAEVARWSAAVAAGRAIYVAARVDIGMANRGLSPKGGTGDTAYFQVGTRAARRAAFRALNRARARLTANERRLSAAVAALDALAVPALRLAA